MTHSPRIPQMRLHKPSGQAYVHLAGQMVYLGKWNKPATIQKYKQVLVEYFSNGGLLPVAPDELTVVELCARYWVHAREYYRDRGGNETLWTRTIRTVLADLKGLYGETLAKEFGASCLNMLRQTWVDRGLARTTIAHYVGITRGMFRWAAARELVPVAVYQSLLALEPFRAGRGQAKEPEPVGPVPLEHVDAIRPYVSRQVAALIDLQLLTGARPGELVALRPSDISQDGTVWEARLARHKTAYKGKKRVVYFGPRAQQVLKPLMLRRTTDYLFSPIEAEAERRARAETHRRPGTPQTPPKTDRTLGDHYTVASYRRAVARACAKARVPVWSPNQLRHNAATEARKRYGLDAAQAVLGHATANVTQVYAELDQEKAKRIAFEIG